MKSEAQIRAIEYVNRCYDELRNAIAKRDAIECCASLEWKAAHSYAKSAAISKENALRHAYEIGALPKPYWV